MAIDQPVTVFPKSKEKAGEKKHTRAEMRRVAEEWERKYGKAGAPTEKISLSDFMSGRNTNTRQNT